MKKEDRFLLLKLLSLNGLSGFETAVRDFIRKKIKPYVDEIRIDKLGNLIAVHKGRKKKVLLAAHMDEIGFLVKNIHHDGFIGVEPVGAADFNLFIGEKVSVRAGRGEINGVLTTRNISRGDPLEENLKLSDIVLDTGRTKKELTGLGVEVGSNIFFRTQPMLMGNKVCSKALDNRIGCAMLLKLAKSLKKSPHEIYYVFSIQEEIGLSGGSTYAYKLDPDYAIAVDVTDADDSQEDANICLGNGPAITVEDTNMISDSKINSNLKLIAKKNRIKYQLEINDKGTTDATNIEVSKEGIPCTVVCVPVRNVHTTFTIASLDDISSTYKLLYSLLRR